MTTDFRALCAELLRLLDEYDSAHPLHRRALITCARAALAKPEAKPNWLTYAKIEERFRQWWHDEGSGMPPFVDEDHEEYARRVSRIAWHKSANVARHVRSAVWRLWPTSSYSKDEDGGLSEIKRLTFPFWEGAYDYTPRSAYAFERYEFSVYDEEDEEQAGGDASTLEQAMQEGNHYLAQYQQEGPCRLELRRVQGLLLPQGEQS